MPTLGPDAGDGGLDFLFEALDQFAIGGDEGLLGFHLGDDVLLNFERRKRKFCFIEVSDWQLRLRGPRYNSFPLRFEIF